MVSFDIDDPQNSMMMIDEEDIDPQLLANALMPEVRNIFLAHLTVDGTKQCSHESSNLSAAGAISERAHGQPREA